MEVGGVPGTITDVPGVLVGNYTDGERFTGCTVVLTPAGAVGGVDVRGSAPGTRETDLLRPENLVDKVQAVVLAGGSAYGLAAACGVSDWLAEHGYGFDAGGIKVPIVPAAVLFDLAFGPFAYPGPKDGYQACVIATAGDFPRGNVGAGTGATVGKVLGPAKAMKSGLGTASLRVGEAVVGALVAVNAFGDVVDPANGQILAGARAAGGNGFVDSVAVLTGAVPAGQHMPPPAAGQNTTIAVVATNAALTKAQAYKVAQMAHDGLARTIRPVHTMWDGDTVFCLSTGQLACDVSVIGTAAAEALAQAIIDAVRSARGALGIPSWFDLHTPA